MNGTTMKITAGIIQTPRRNMDSWFLFDIARSIALPLWGDELLEALQDERTACKLIPDTHFISTWHIFEQVLNFTAAAPSPEQLSAYLNLIYEITNIYPLMFPNREHLNRVLIEWRDAYYPIYARTVEAGVPVEDIVA